MPVAIASPEVFSIETQSVPKTKSRHLLLLRLLLLLGKTKKWERRVKVMSGLNSVVYEGK